MITVLQDQSELRLYYEHDYVDNLIQLTKGKIRDLENIEAERREREAAEKREHEELQRREQEAARAREREFIEGMARPSTVYYGNASQVRVRKKSLAVKTKKKKDKGNDKKCADKKKKSNDKKRKSTEENESVKRRPNYKSKDRFNATPHAE
ncbi:axoneme-associated protein mst101(1)-like [Punica granatum]|uniref:Axoneme-associated protein mst101(1)-like n=1 Tax=Punica granatum TaxID=22663 RepID=A0A6P8E198_PUNGR|nr:axoneme-associated protein mst101(1)-like [Punica granatum]